MSGSAEPGKFEPKELEAVFTVGLIMAIRLLGIFLILPVFSVYAERYPGADIALAGVAFGIYALVQSVLQIPFGWASDRIGRKPVLILGLALFTAGSLLCALTDNITELIIARAIQGSGAISSVAIASMGDLTRPELRARAFTIVGLIIGGAFLAAIIIGPLVAAKTGFSSLFFILAGLGCVAVAVTLLFFPSIGRDESLIREEVRVLSYIGRPEIKRLLISGMMLSFTVNLFVFIYPLSWTAIGVSADHLWFVYLIILAPTAFFVYPFVRRAEKKGNLKTVLTAAWALIALTFLIYPTHQWAAFLLYLAGMIYFAGHTILQSLFPAFLTQRVGQENRGTTTGFYNLSSFLGASLGGMLAGYLYQLNPHLPPILSLLLVIAWGLTSLPAPPGDKTA